MKKKKSWYTTVTIADNPSSPPTDVRSVAVISPQFTAMMWKAPLDADSADSEDGGLDSTTH